MNDCEEKKENLEFELGEITQSKFTMRSSSLSRRYYSSNNFSLDMIPMSQSINIYKPSRATHFGFDILKTVSLLTFNPKEQAFFLSGIARELLSGLEGECFIVSVSGSPLVGKSSFLNLMVSYFAYHSNDVTSQVTGEKIPYQPIYTVGDGARSTTEGIDIYCITVGNKHLLVCDIEGDNDPSRKDTGVWIYTNLITTAVAVSHMQLYNYTGLPQQTFLSYFDSVSKLVSTNKLHPEFKPEFHFMKKNHDIFSEEDIEEDLPQFEQYFKENLPEVFSQGCVHLLKTPPEHILQSKNPESCIKNGLLCEECQQDFYFKECKKIFDSIFNLMSTKSGYKNGEELVKTIERVLEINRRDLKFTPDLGHISKIRLAKFQKENTRIHQELLEAEPIGFERNLSLEIQKIVSDHPKLADTELLSDFDSSMTVVFMRLTQMDFLIPEISKFCEECILDKTFVILDKDEKTILAETYITPFLTVTEDLIKALRQYEKVADGVIKKLLEIKEDIKKNVTEYMRALSDAKSRSVALTTNIASSAALAFFAREVGLRIVAGFVVGGGAIGAILTIYFLAKAKQKLDEAKKKNMEVLNGKKIAGVNNEGEAKEVLRMAEEFIDQIVGDLRNKNKTLKDVCSEEKSKNFLLAERIEGLLNKKLLGDEITVSDQVSLIQAMKVSENNLKRFKECI